MAGFWRDLRRLPLEHQLAGAAALGLVVSMFLPWYVDRDTVVVRGRPETIDESLTGISVFTWVEAAILLVALAILGLIAARARRRPFHLPGGDGTVVLAAGVWTALLVLYRMAIDRPGSTDELGIEWGIFFALVAAGALAWTGWRIRAAHRPEPPLPAAAAAPEPTSPLTDGPAPDRRPHTTPTEPLAPTGTEEPPRPFDDPHATGRRPSDSADDLTVQDVPAYEPPRRPER